MPASIFNSVVLPAPLGPQADTIAFADLPRHVLEEGLLAERFCYILQLEQELFAERPRRRGKHLRHTEWLCQISGHAEIDRVDRARLGREAGNDDHREILFKRFASRMSVSQSIPGIFRSAISRS